MSDKIKEFNESVLRTWNTESEDPFLNAVMGVAGEAGEVVDLLKKEMFHGKKVDKSNYVNELGDVLYYVFAACHELGVSVEEVMQFNKEKLEHRFPSGFVKGNR